MAFQARPVIVHHIDETKTKSIQKI